MTRLQELATVGLCMPLIACLVKLQVSRSCLCQKQTVSHHTPAASGLVELAAKQHTLVPPYFRHVTHARAPRSAAGESCGDRPRSTTRLRTHNVRCLESPAFESKNSYADDNSYAEDYEYSTDNLLLPDIRFSIANSAIKSLQARATHYSRARPAILRVQLS